MKPFVLSRPFVAACFLVSICSLLLNCKTQKKEIGPNTVSENWGHLGPGGGGSTFIPTFSYRDPDRFMVNCDMSGSYLTKDGGTTFKQKNFMGGATCYAYDPNDADIIYAASSFLHKSVDGGGTWELIFPKKDEIISQMYIGDHADFEVKTIETSLYANEVAKINSIKVDPIGRGTLYFAMANFFFYTFDGGETWNREDLRHTIDNIYTNGTSAKNEVYIFSPEIVFIFDKTSKSFTQRAVPKAMSPAISFSAGNLKNSTNTVFYALHHDAAKKNPYEFVHSAVWTSVDFGINWKQMEDAVITNGKTGTKPSFSMVSCAENDASNAYVVTNNYEEKNEFGTLVKWYGALKTGDSGTTWNWVWKGGGGSGQYRVQDAHDVANLKDSWVKKAFGNEFIQLLDVGVSPQNGNTAVVTDWYRTMKTMDGGNTWNEIYSKQHTDDTFTSRGMDVTTSYGVHFDPFDKNHIGISYTDIGYHRSLNGGESWSRATTGVPNDWTNTCYWVVFDPSIKNKMWSAWSGIHDFPRGKMTRSPNWKKSDIAKGGVCVSLDGGKTWAPTIDGMGDDSPTTSIIIDPKSTANNRTLYASVYGKGVFKSIDDGKTWHLKNNGIGANTSAFELTMANNGVLFLTISPTPMHKDGKKGSEFYSGAVYRSTDGAETWILLNVNNGLLFPNGIAIDPDNPDRIYLGCWASIGLADLVGSDVARSVGGDKLLDMPGGIFMSEDGGDSWKSIFDEKQYVYDVTVDPYRPGRLYCNTFNQTAYLSDDYGKTWGEIKDYDFRWGHRVIVDENDHEKVYMTTFGSSVWHGIPKLGTSTE